MIERPFWLRRIQNAWRKRPIVWLAGVRQSGKTTLAKMLGKTVFLNCDLPSVALRLNDPESFFHSQEQGAIIVFDEIHRLPDPSRILKIASDEFKTLKILATGSSTLATSKKFRDTLTGRKTVLQLLPVLWKECIEDFKIRTLDKRLLNGGLPAAMLGEDRNDEFYSEWMDSYYARDIQELFVVRDRTGFLNLLKLLLRQSGGLADYTALSRECDLSRQTIKAYIEAMLASCTIYSLSPFHGGGRRELLRRPKVYGFDTGFVAYARGWNEIRDGDRGVLWEHLVLDVLRTAVVSDRLFYWRDKSGREIDFVISRGSSVDTIECKINPDRFNTDSLRVFRSIYPKGENYLACPFLKESYQFTTGGFRITVTDSNGLINTLPANSSVPSGQE